MPISYQEGAGGSKSAKFVTANPLDPILRPFASEDAHEDDPQRMLADSVNERLTRAMNELKVKHAQGRNDVDDPDRAPTGSAYNHPSRGMMPQQHTGQQQQQQTQKQHQQSAVSVVVTPRANETSNDDDDDEDYDWLLDEDGIVDDSGDDRPILEALRERRLAELKREAEQKAADLARGHGELRTIAQDEFLPECAATSKSEWVAVHFYHNEFQRCKVMDHHLKIVAVRHTECKFLRIDAEKAPFFVNKLQIRTLPTLLVLRRGNVVDRMVGFEKIQTADVNTKPLRHFADKIASDPDQWKTSELQKWLAKSGAIQYCDEPEEVEEAEIRRQRTQGCLHRGGVRHFEDDDCY